MEKQTPSCAHACAHAGSIGLATTITLASVGVGGPSFRPNTLLRVGFELPPFLRNGNCSLERQRLSREHACSVICSEILVGLADQKSAG